jgi:GDP-4-dehydro-6-deoxy-D-mannose reductase
VCRDLLDVRDVVGAYERVMEAAPSGRVFNVASGHAERVGDLLDRLISLARCQVHIVPDESRLRPVDARVFVGDATRLRTELGWEALIPIDQTLDDTLAWWREHLSQGR